MIELHLQKMTASSSFWEQEQQDEPAANDRHTQRALERLRKLYTLSLTKLRQHQDRYGDLNYKTSPFQLRWIRGYNLKAGMINLNNNGSTTMFYAATNCGVLFNWSLKQMKILQGHRHSVTCVASDKEGKWLVTADSGPENCVIVWDGTEYFPYRTIFNPHGSDRTARVTLSSDAKYIMTMGYTGDVATIHFWIWSLGLSTPHAALTTKIPKGKVVTMRFNPHNSSQFIVLTQTQLWIGAAGKKVIMDRGVLKITDDYELKLRSPDTWLSPEHGKMVCICFVEETSQILVGTSRGLVMVFGYTIEYNENVDCTNHENIKFIKFLKVEKHRINAIKSVDGLIVTGGNKGDIHFYDNQMKLLYWIHGFKVDCVKNLTFNRSPRSYQILDPKCQTKCFCWEKVETIEDPITGLKTQKLLKYELPTQSTLEGKPMVVRDFIVYTGANGVWFCDFVTETLQPILETQAAAVYTMTVHPDKPFMAIGNADGVVDLWNVITHELFKRIHLRQFYKIVIPPDNDSVHCFTEEIIPELSVTCLKYSPSGLHLGCGLNTGELLFLDPTTVDVVCVKKLHDTTFAITAMEYSVDSTTLATADVGKTVCVYKFNCDTKSWYFIAKHRAHYKSITSIMFLPQKNEDGNFKLISIGADRMLAEYNIGASHDESLNVVSLDRIEQSAQPLSAMAWPGPKDLDPKIHNTDLPLLLIANTEFKYKIINLTTGMTLATVLGPRFEHPVSRIQLINIKRGVDNAEEEQYLLFTTKVVIGLQKLPLDGNPYKHTGLVAHPEQITDIEYREDIGMLYTSGIRDNCICQWEADYSAIDSFVEQGGDELDPYYCLIEDGRPGWLFQEIRDLFYYIQILCQGTFSPAMRRVKDFIPIDSLPDMMRALGFYPSEFEVENLLVEAKYQVYRKEPENEIDFVNFVKYYINHRPAFPLNHMQIYQAFKHFARIRESEEYSITSKQLLNTLRENGECFSPELSWYLLSILSGHSFEDRANMEKEDFSFLPENITYHNFIHDILGISEPKRGSSEQYSVGRGNSPSDSDSN